MGELVAGRDQSIGLGLAGENKGKVRLPAGVKRSIPVYVQLSQRRRSAWHRAGRGSAGRTPAPEGIALSGRDRVGNGDLIRGRRGIGRRDLRAGLKAAAIGVKHRAIVGPDRVKGGAPGAAGISADGILFGHDGRQILCSNCESGSCTPAQEAVGILPRRQLGGHGKGVGQRAVVGDKGYCGAGLVIQIQGKGRPPNGIERLGFVSAHLYNPLEAVEISAVGHVLGGRRVRFIRPAQEAQVFIERLRYLAQKIELVGVPFAAEAHAREGFHALSVEVKVQQEVGAPDRVKGLAAKASPVTVEDDLIASPVNWHSIRFRGPAQEFTTGTDRVLGDREGPGILGTGMLQHRRLHAGEVAAVGIKAELEVLRPDRVERQLLIAVVVRVLDPDRARRIAGQQRGVVRPEIGRPAPAREIQC